MSAAKILFKYASRSRPDKFFDGLDSIFNNLFDFEHFHISCTLDRDDESMNNKSVIDRIGTYKNTSIAWGLSEGKIHAINRDFPDYPFSILICMSDDMRFIAYGFDDIIRNDMTSLFPLYDGLLHYPDQDAKDALAVLYIAGRQWWARRNKKIYHPSYKSLWCDNEEMEVAKRLNKYALLSYTIVDHQCPGWGRAKKDEMYIRQEKYWEEDESNFNFRKSINFEIMLLSILIPTTIDRREQFAKLKEEFKRQISEGGYSDSVEIKSLEDNKEMSVGKKRDILYKAAVGKYSLQWDSDDWVAPDAISRILFALEENPDCVTYKEHCQMDGEIKFSNFSLGYPDWLGGGNIVLSDGFHFQRTPFFKTPILTSLCKQVGVEDMRFGEDHDFARRIKPLLKTEIHIDQFIYYYEHTSSDHNTRYGITETSI